MMDDWTPLPPSEKKEAEKKFNKDKELLDRAYMRGQFTQEYYLNKISELIVRYGLAPPEWTADESLELDLELDILEHEMEEKAWEPLSGEEREKAEKKLLKEKKFLNKAFKLGKISQENCMTRVKEVEILLGLEPPEEVEEEPPEKTPEPEQEASEEDWDTGAVGGEAGYEAETAEADPEEVEEAPPEEVPEEVEEDHDSAEEEIEAKEPEEGEDMDEKVECPNCSASVSAAQENCDLCGALLISLDADTEEESIARLMMVPGIGETKASILFEAGFRGPMDLVECSIEELSEVRHIGPKTAQKIKIAVSKLSELSGEEEVELPEPEEPAATEPEVEEELEDAELLEDIEMLGDVDILEDIELLEDIEMLEDMDRLEDFEDLPDIKKTTLIIGIVLCILGLVGVMGLRLGLVQEYLFGDPTPYPGIGYVEPTGHIVSIIPFVMGVLTIFYWGIKNDSLYHDKQLAKKELEEPEYEPEPIEEPVAEPDSVEEVIERDRAEFCEKMLLSAYVLDEDMEMLKELIGTGIGKEEFSEEMGKAVERRRAAEQQEKLERELAEELSEISGDEEDDIDDILKEIEELEDF